jgi:sensor histidine kinase YesM
MTAKWFRHHIRRMAHMPSWPLAALLAWALAAAGLEIWALWMLNPMHPWGGVLTGACIAGLLGLVMGRVTATSPSRELWKAVLVFTLQQCLLVCLVGSFTAILICFLPLQLSEKIFAGAASQDFLLLTLLGLMMVSAAHTWSRYKNQQHQAQLSAQTARAHLAEQEKNLLNTELELAKARIEPHFLWNTLGHLQHLIGKRPDEAEKMARDLIAFLRCAQTNLHQGLCPLHEELERVVAYLNIMKIRMGPRLQHEIQADTHWLNTPVLPMMIQTLVENAIKHGIEPCTGPGHIHIRLGPAPDNPRTLEVTVHDQSSGQRSAPIGPGLGTGLHTLKARLQQQFGQQASFNLCVNAEEGSTATLRIPLVPSSPPHEPDVP